jgi:glycosyltransferase involved in cell wall biosynthesis
VYGGAEFTDGGIGFLQNLCHALQTLGHQCTVVLGESNELLLTGAVEREFHVTGDWSLGCNPEHRASRKELRQAILQAAPDVIHVIHPCGYYGPKGHIHVLPVVWREVPVVTTFWGLNIGRDSNLVARTVVPLLLWRSHAVAAHDFSLIQQLRRFSFYTRTVYFLPVGSNVLPSPSVIEASREQLRVDYKLKPDAKYVCFFGGFDRSRGLDDLFAAVRLLRDRGWDNLYLLMIGWQRHFEKPSFQRVKELIKRKDLASITLMTPYAPDDEVAGLMRASDVCVFPFHSNAIGRSSLMAALCAGVPIVLASATAELGVLSRAVYRIPSKNSAKLAGAIECLLRDSERAGDLAATARQVWLKEFTWEAIARKHLQVYNEIIGK